MSFVLGGIVLCICDTIARSVMAAEIPVGIITAIVGAPFFIYLLARKAYGGDVMSGEILKFEHVTVGYDARDVVRDFSCSIRQGEFVSLIGPNGSGKSTLIHTVTGITKLKAGRIFLDGKDNEPFLRRSARRLRQ